MPPCIMRREYASVHYMEERRVGGRGLQRRRHRQQQTDRWSLRPGSGQAPTAATGGAMILGIWGWKDSGCKAGGETVERTTLWRPRVAGVALFLGQKQPEPWSRQSS